MNGQITRVSMLILMEPTLEEAVEFYKNLGFQLVFHLKERWAEFALPNVRIGLCPTSNPPVEGHTGIVLEVDDVRQFYERLKDQIPFVREPLEATHGIMVSFRDPGGNIIDLYQPTPEKVQALVKEKAGKSCGTDECCKADTCDKPDDCCAA